MEIKLGLGKLKLPAPLAHELPHVLELGKLPAHHNDPFDRLLIVQAQVEGAAILSADPQLARYPVTVE